MRSFIGGVAVAIIALLAASCTTTGASTDAAPDASQGWQPLFDGKTLTGWTPKIRGFALGDNYRDTFRVRDGAIVVSYDK